MKRSSSPNFSFPNRVASKRRKRSVGSSPRKTTSPFFATKSNKNDNNNSDSHKKKKKKSLDDEDENKKSAALVMPEAARSTPDLFPIFHSPQSSPKKNSPPASQNNTLRTPSSTPRTSSFGALTADSFPDLSTTTTPIHTLILGTHPSVESLSQQRYFGHPMNAFWWIAGDCLGFRRGPALTKSGNRPYAFAKHLYHPNSHIVPYEEQTRRFCENGFALWDVVGECQRQGSLDSNIQHEVPNDIRAFCHQHRHSLRRIVFANGGTGCRLFNKHFKDWWKSGELVASVEKDERHEQQQKVFEKVSKKKPFGRSSLSSSPVRLECLSAISVSPAAATFSYEEKRNFWEEYVYKPGLKMHEENMKSIVTVKVEIDGSNQFLVNPS